MELPAAVWLEASPAEERADDQDDEQDDQDQPENSFNEKRPAAEQ